MQWHYIENNQQMGPIEQEQFRELVNDGTITSQTFVWHGGLDKWKPYGQVYAQAAEAAASTQPAMGGHYCTECGNAFDASEMVSYGESWICATCKPVFFQRIREGAPLPGTMNYAGFWIRFCAKFVDGLILLLVELIVMSSLGVSILPTIPGSFETNRILAGFIQFVLAATYTTWFIGRFGATPGKMVCGLKIVRSSQEKVTYLRAFGRHFAEMLSKLTCCIGYIMAAFDDEKRSLHDRICDTRVIYK